MSHQLIEVNGNLLNQIQLVQWTFQRRAIINERESYRKKNMDTSISSQIRHENVMKVCLSTILKSLDPF